MERTHTVARTKPTEPAPTAEDVPETRAASGYTVVARRYRPQRFEDVVGQDHVVQALRNAIRLHRVTHAYLFSGTRGVGKTSIARIFAKCLNCVKGPTESPCDECEICRDIATGQDIDVIEIDGASNNGVEAVRELRQNAGLRPSRARFKIYYIDEVHMLSTGAFNALLKTLEEPPEHVKFFFATTEPNKIPITVLSRCQRFDFAGIAPEQIIESLANICGVEGIAADREALQAVARRAGGSMRDAQSLLEQLLSFGGKRLTSEIVHQALGLAPDDRVLDLIDALADHDPAKALTLIDGAADQGVQPVELLQGVLEFMRDLMVVAAGAEIDTLAASPSERGRLRAVADRWPLDSILAALQVLAETRLRLRGSAHGRLLIEMAFCRVARLEDFHEISEIIARLTPLESEAPAPKKKLTPAVEPRPTPAPAPASVGRPEPPPRMPQQSVAAQLTLEGVRDAWKLLPEKLGFRLGTWVSQVQPSAIEPPDGVVVPLAEHYNNGDPGAAEIREVRAGITEKLRELLGRPVTLRFEAPAPSPTAESSPNATRQDELLADPLVRKAKELFEARPVRIQYQDDSEPTT